MTVDDVLQATGATYRQLCHWRYRGWISPELGGAIGSGYSVLWTDEDLAQVRRLVAASAFVRRELPAVVEDLARLGAFEKMTRTALDGSTERPSCAPRPSKAT